MTTQEMLSHVDHTLLQATATWPQIEALCREAIEYRTASVCIPPCYIRRVRETFGSAVTICTVIGFPLGYSVTAAKVTEAREALRDGADEIDMVINISDIKNGDYDKAEAEIAAVREACQGCVLKVIVETCYLTEKEKVAACGIVTRAGADYIKTSTGFGTAGATREDITLFREHVGPAVAIKAAGGIRSIADMQAFLELGAERLGTSSAIKLIRGEESRGY